MSGGGFTVAPTFDPAVPEGAAHVGLNCPRGTHALTAGYAGSPPGSLTDKTQFRLQVVQSRRTTKRQWTIIAVNPAGAPGPASLTTNVACEVNRKGGAVSEKSAVAWIVNDGRTSAIAACTGNKHVVGGGFSLLPAVGPVISVDQTQPVGKKSWRVGLYEFANKNLPGGSSLTTYAYCKKN